MATPQSSTSPLTSASAQASAPSVPNSDKIHWATASAGLSDPQLQAQFEVAKSRNWINDRLIAQSQRHWHCTRDQAIERLLTQHS